MSEAAAAAAAPATTSSEPAAAAASSEPAAAAAPIEPAAPAAAAAATPKWTDGMTPDHLTYIEGKQFSDPSALLNSYMNLEKLHTTPADRILKLPEKSDDPAWKNVYQRLGAPDSPEGYGIEPVEGEVEGFADWAKKTFHHLNITKEQAAGILDSYQGFTQDGDAAELEAYKATVESQDNSLKKEWGSAYEQNIKVAQHAARTFGLPSEAIDALEQAIGYDGVMKFMSNVGAKLGEAPYIDSGGGTGAFGPNTILTPEQARSQISMLKNDKEFVSSYLSRDAKAVAKMERLHQMANPNLDS